MAISEWPGQPACTEEYRRCRYYSHLTDAQLCLRYAALLRNVVRFDDGGRAFFEKTFTPYWSWRLAWAEEEFRLRAAPQRILAIRQQEIERPRPRAIAARELFAKAILPPFGSYVVKFGQRAHIEEMLSRGRFRISTAASYDDPSLNPAIRDDELQAAIMFPAGTQLHVSVDGEYREIPGILGPLRSSRRCANFYVFCASGYLDPRLFDDFQADACLLVRDLNYVGLLLLRGFAAMAGMTRQAHGSVHYEDPLHPVKEVHAVELTKHFQYSYQKEWRMVWNTDEPLPPTAAPQFVEIGSLAGSCEAYYL